MVSVDIPTLVAGQDADGAVIVTRQRAATVSLPNGKAVPAQRAVRAIQANQAKGGNPMKRNLLTLSLLIVLTVETSYAADNAVASVDIAEVSALLEIADGLYILDATVYGDGTGIGQLSTSGVTISTYNSAAVMDSVLVVDKDTVMVSGREGEGLVVALLHGAGGVDIIIRRKPVTAGSTYHIGIADRVLFLWLVYHDGASTEKSVIVRISGNWEAYGLDLPDDTPSADLNRDGKVDSLDLLLLQAQWNPK